MDERQIHELIGRLIVQIEVLRLALEEAQAKLEATRTTKTEGAT